MPVHKGRLKEADYTKVQMNFIFLKKELDGNYLLDEMFAANVFTMDDKREIQSETSRDKRTDMFLDKLLDSGPDAAYGVFLRALENHYPHVAQMLKDNVSEDGGDFSKDSPVDENPPCRQSRDEQAGTDSMRPLAGSKEHWVKCMKNPGHKGFIPVKKFDTSHLPSHFQLPEVVEYVKVLADQTVLTLNTLISFARPEGYHRSQYKGKDVTLCGSGRVWRIMRNFSQLDNSTCPCGVCKKSSLPAKQWGQFIVVTAKNLVFNDEECANTKFMLWYDEEKPDQSYPALMGVRMVNSDIVNDYSEVLCVTHDKVVSEKLESICQRNEDLSTTLARNCYKRKFKEKVTIIISHPHYSSKHVTVGKWVEGDNDRSGGPSNHVYTTDTCPGSGGAPVLLLDDRLSCCSTDSGRSGKLNQSGGKLWPL